jgi:hypothetical protein
MAKIDLNLPPVDEEADGLFDCNGVVPDQEDDAMIGAREHEYDEGAVAVDGIQIVHPFDLNFHDAEAQEEFIPG